MTIPKLALRVAVSEAGRRADDLVPPTNGYGDQWAAELLAALHDAGYALTPLAPEPPRRDGLREALMAVQWVQQFNNSRAECPWCGAFREDGHEPHCRRQAALAAPEPPDSAPSLRRFDALIEEVDRAEPPDSEPGTVAPWTGEYLPGAEPPDSGDAARWCEKHDRLEHRYPEHQPATEPRDAGIDAALLAEAEHKRACEWRHTHEASAHEPRLRAVITEYARLRSGSPAPEGGE